MELTQLSQHQLAKSTCTQGMRGWKTKANILKQNSQNFRGHKDQLAQTLTSRVSRQGIGEVQTQTQVSS